MPIEHKPHRASSMALAHLDGYSTKRSNRHFLRAMLSRSISSVNHTTLRSEFSIPALSSLAIGRRARRLHRNTNAYPPAPKRVLTAKMQIKLTIALTHAAISPSSAMAHGATIRGEP
jgi:hypothetical protein